MVEITQRRVETAPGIELVVHEAGRPGDPVAVLCHGFPECAHSWRHQFAPLVDAGYHVLAPDQRGYGYSSAPRDVAAYGVDALLGDLLALCDDADATDAVFIGHDWGAFLVWHMAQLHPERARAVVAASVPYTSWPMRPTALMQSMYGDLFFYMLYFQQVGPPEAELEADVADTMRTILWAASGSCFGTGSADPLPAAGTGFLDSLRHHAGAIPDGLPDWVTADDFAVYVDAFETSGFFGPISWYRNLDANHDRTATVDPASLTMPTFFIGGTHDAVIATRPGYVEAMEGLLPDYRGHVLIEGAGHWTQQEAPAAFNSALVEFLGTLPEGTDR